MGYENQTILQIANYCFRSSIKTLESMDYVINKFFKIGIVSMDSLQQYLSDISVENQKIQVIFDELDISRKIRQQDRKMYQTWTKTWGISQDLIMFTLPMCAGKENQLQYLNRVLSDYKTKGLLTLELYKNSEQYRQNKNNDIKKDNNNKSRGLEDYTN